MKQGKTIIHSSNGVGPLRRHDVWAFDSSAHVQYKNWGRVAQKSRDYDISIKRQNSTVPLTKGRRTTFGQSLEKSTLNRTKTTHQKRIVPRQIHDR